MLFNSFQFIQFFVVTAVIYFSVPARARWLVLLTASVFYYACFAPIGLAVMAAVILGGYGAALLLDRVTVAAQRRYILLTGIFFNVALLATFKYLFLAQPLFSMPLPRLLAPIGLSFYIFQNMGYLIDVYRGTIRAERHIGMFSLFIMLFPKVAMGPIERGSALLPQLRALPAFDYTRVSEGLKLIAWGWFEKAVIADRLALYVNPVFSAPRSHVDIQLLVAVFFYSWQIYFDFCAYTDVAIGVAKVLGISLADNFQRPYAATSISQFWQRWHMSLSNWLRDYLFLPISYAVLRKIPKERAWGIKTESVAYAVAMMTTMIICGIWHGAALTFLLWGGLHGFFMLFSHLSRHARARLRKRLHVARDARLLRYFRVALTFVLVSWAWIFFRCVSVRDALYVALHAARAPFALLAHFNREMLRSLINQFPLSYFMIIGACLALVWLVQRAQRGRGSRYMLSEHPLWLRWSFYYLLLVAIFFVGIFNTSIDFIYFQF